MNIKRFFTMIFSNLAFYYSSFRLSLHSIFLPHSQLWEGGSSLIFTGRQLPSKFKLLLLLALWMKCMEREIGPEMSRSYQCKCEYASLPSSPEVQSLSFSALICCSS